MKWFSKGKVHTSHLQEIFIKPGDYSTLRNISLKSPHTHPSLPSSFPLKPPFQDGPSSHRIPSPQLTMQLSLLSSLLALPLALGAAPTVVKVGEGSSLTFSPSTVTVPVGGVVEFHFYPMKHSVAQGTFEDPCKPLSNSSFWSGAFATSDPKGNATTFSITVKDDKPIYFYCAFPSHCGSGMVGIVNAP